MAHKILVKEYPVKFINIKERSMVKARNVGSSTS